MAVDGMPTGFIDWETAGPIDPVWELAQVAWLNAHPHDDDVAQRVGLGDAAARGRRVGFVDRMVEFAVHSSRADAVEYHVTDETRSGVGDDGFPFVWGITWRVPCPSWMLTNRSTLERAIGR